jgi:esterase/lipase superfamily enzyme
VLSLFQSIAVALRFGRASRETARTTYSSLHALVHRLTAITDSHYLLEASQEAEPTDHKLSASDDEKRALVIVAHLLVTQALRELRRVEPNTPDLAEARQRDIIQLSNAQRTLSKHLPQAHSGGFYAFPPSERSSHSAQMFDFDLDQFLQNGAEKQQYWVPFSSAADLSVPQLRVPSEAGRLRAPYREHVYYATDRQSTRSSDGAPYYDNSGIPSEALTYGRCIVTLPPGHREGIVESPTGDADFNPQRHVVVDENTALDQEAFASALHHAFVDSSSTDMFLFVHGAATSFDAAIKRAAQIRFDTKFRGTAVAYSWPSKGDFRAYGADYDRVDLAAQQAARFLEHLATVSPSGKIHVIAHSLGCLIAAEAVGKLTSSAGQRISEVILGAPDISSIDYPQLAEALRRHAQRVTVYAAPADRALLASAALRIGIRRAGADVRIAAHQGVDAIDASAVVKKSWFGDRHSYIFEAGLVYELSAVLDGKAQLRPFLDERANPPPTYYVMRRR